MAYTSSEKVAWEENSHSSFPIFSVPSLSTLDAPPMRTQLAFSHSMVAPINILEMLKTKSVS